MTQQLLDHILDQTENHHIIRNKMEVIRRSFPSILIHGGSVKIEKYCGAVVHKMSQFT